MKARGPRHRREDGDATWLVRAAAKEGLDLPAGAAARFEQYAALLDRWGRAIRLLGGRNPREWWEAHFFDSLLVLHVLPHAPDRGGPMLDVGSGAGLPGIPIAIARPYDVTLLEANARKAVFLRTVVAELGLSAVRVECARAEEGAAPRFRAVVSRALCAPAEWIALARGWVAPGGRVIAMLGREQPSEATLATLGAARGLALEVVRRFQLPLSGAERAIVSWVAGE
jgi:16S rRNA (guanine527-N7)-methyltransferase